MCFVFCYSGWEYSASFLATVYEMFFHHFPLVVFFFLSSQIPLDISDDLKERFLVRTGRRVSRHFQLRNKQESADEDLSPRIVRMRAETECVSLHGDFSVDEWCGHSVLREDRSTQHTHAGCGTVSGTHSGAVREGKKCTCRKDQPHVHWEVVF